MEKNSSGTADPNDVDSPAKKGSPPSRRTVKRGGVIGTVVVGQRRKDGDGNSKRPLVQIPQGQKKLPGPAAFSCGYDETKAATITAANDRANLDASPVTSNHGIGQTGAQTQSHQTQTPHSVQTHYGSQRKSFRGTTSFSSGGSLMQQSGSVRESSVTVRESSLTNSKEREQSLRSNHSNCNEQTHQSSNSNSASPNKSSGPNFRTARSRDNLMIVTELNEFDPSRSASISQSRNQSKESVMSGVSQSQSVSYSQSISNSVRLGGRNSISRGNSASVAGNHNTSGSNIMRSGSRGSKGSNSSKDRKMSSTVASSSSKTCQTQKQTPTSVASGSPTGSKSTFKPSPRPMTTTHATHGSSRSFNRADSLGTGRPMTASSSLNDGYRTSGGSGSTLNRNKAASPGPGSGPTGPQSCTNATSRAKNLWNVARSRFNSLGGGGNNSNTSRVTVPGQGNLPTSTSNATNVTNRTSISSLSLPSNTGSLPKSISQSSAMPSASSTNTSSSNLLTIASRTSSQTPKTTAESENPETNNDNNGVADKFKEADADKVTAGNISNLPSPDSVGLQALSPASAYHRDLAKRLLKQVKQLDFQLEGHGPGHGVFPAEGVEGENEVECQDLPTLLNDIGSVVETMKLELSVGGVTAAFKGNDSEAVQG